MSMTAQTKRPQMPPVNPEARSEPRPPVPATEAKGAGPSAYWGDRLTLKFWFLCVGLMAAMHLVEALHRFVLFLMGRSPAP
jgi:hypothetical protein